MAEIWVLGLCVLLGMVLAGLVNKDSWKMRVVFVVGVFVLFDLLLPEDPLSFVDNPRVQDFSTAIVLWAVLFLVSIVGVVWSFKRLRLSLLPYAVAGVMVSVLSFGQHMVLVNGLDHTIRQGHVVSLVSDGLSLDTHQALCTMSVYVCDVRDQEPNPSLNNNIEFGTSLLDEDGMGVLVFSDASTMVVWPYVLVMWKQGDAVFWMARDHTLERHAVATSLWIVLNAILVFWGGGAFLVEWLHKRRLSRKRVRKFVSSVDGESKSENSTRPKS